MGIISAYAIPRRLQLRWSGHLVPMDDEQSPKRLFHGDIATASRRQGGQLRRYKDTLQTSLRRLHNRPGQLGRPLQDLPTWRRTVMTGTEILEANCITAAKARHQARKSQPPPSRNVNSQPIPTFPRCQRTFRAPHPDDTIGCPPSISASLSPPPNRTVNTDRTPGPPLPSSFLALTSAVTAPAPTATALNHNTPTMTNLTTANTSDMDSVHACPHYD
nr:unnamed protein product [Spirometra erinaceieuropaei]